jgi:small subunit ribosomal protein S19
MARSLWKGPFVDSYLLKKSNKILNMRERQNNPITGQSVSDSQRSILIESSLNNQGMPLRSGDIPRISSGPIRVWSRRSFILPEFIDQFFEIYNGKQFISFQVNEDMVGHKFGEFASTRKKTLHKKKIKSKG